MTPNGQTTDEQRFGNSDGERRLRPRIYERFPLRVRGSYASGERFDVETVLDNIGSKGLYVRLARDIEPGSDLFVVVRLSAANNGQVFAPRVAIHGEVLRTEPQADGLYGVAIEFHHRRFL
jgi:hypothetical protein